MSIAAFESEPQASATAIQLRERGFTADVVVRTDEGYDDRMREFFQGQPQSHDVHALVISDADRESFENVVRRHYGQLVRDPAG